MHTLAIISHDIYNIVHDHKRGAYILLRNQQNQSTAN